MSKRSVVSRLAQIRSWPWLTISKIVGVIVVGVIVALIVHRVFILPGELRQETADARHETKAATGTANMAETTLETIENRTSYREITREIVRTNEHDILSAPGSSAPVSSDVHGAGIGSLRKLREQADQRERPSAGLPEVRP